MNWTTEYLARKVKSGEKKKHKERRAVEIMLQQSRSIRIYIKEKAGNRIYFPWTLHREAGHERMGYER